MIIPESTKIYGNLDIWTNATITSGGVGSFQAVEVSPTGLRFPNDAFGGGGDSAGMRLVSRSGENTSLEIYTTNDAGADWINLIVPSVNDAKINDYTIWNNGNFDPANYSLSGHTHSITNILDRSSVYYDDNYDVGTAKYMRWKNAGDNHEIIDASNSTAPNGTSIDNSNSFHAWTATYPTLVGWNGTATYGVRVDSARVSDSASTLGGIPVERFVFGDNGSGTIKNSGPFGNIAKSGFYNNDTSTDAPNPSTWTHLIHSDYTGDDNWAWQLAANFEAGNLEEYSTRIKVNGNWYVWRKIWTTKDISQANVDSWNVAATSAHNHANKSNLDTINQNLGTGYSPTFAGLTVGNISNTEFSYLDGTSANIQTQLNQLSQIAISGTGSGTANKITKFVSNTAMADSTITDDGSSVTFSTQVTVPRINLPNNTQSLYVGDDVSIGDINVAHALGIKSQTNTNYGYIRFGSDSNGIGYNGTYLEYAGSTLFGAGSKTPNSSAKFVFNVGNNDYNGIDIFGDRSDKATFINIGSLSNTSSSWAIQKRDDGLDGSTVGCFAIEDSTSSGNERFPLSIMAGNGGHLLFNRNITGYTGKMLAMYKDTTPTTASNTNYANTPIVINRTTSDSSTSTVAGLGFHNVGVNAAMLYYDPTTSVFKYNRNVTGPLVTIWDDSTFNPNDYSLTGHSHKFVVGDRTAPYSSAVPSSWYGDGLYMARVYNQDYPSAFGNVLSLDGTGRNQIFTGWSGDNGGFSGMWIRNKRDAYDGWSGWQKILDYETDSISIEHWNDSWARTIQSNVGVNCYQANDGDSWQTRMNARGNHFGRYDNSSNGSPRYLNYTMLRETTNTVYGILGYSSDNEWYVGKSNYNAEISNYYKIWTTKDITQNNVNAWNNPGSVCLPLSGGTMNGTIAMGSVGGNAGVPAINFDGVIQIDGYKWMMGDTSNGVGFSIYANGYEREIDGGGNSVTIRNERGPLNIGYSAQPVRLSGTTFTANGNTIWTTANLNVTPSHLSGTTSNLQTQIDNINSTMPSTILSTVTNTYLTSTGRHLSATIPGNTFNSTVPTQVRVVGNIGVNYVGGTSNIELKLDGNTIFSHSLTATGESQSDTFEIDFTVRNAGFSSMEVYGLCKMCNTNITTNTAKMRVVSSSFSMTVSNSCIFDIVSTLSGTATAAITLAKVTRG
jgi:hypothetical protein